MFEAEKMQASKWFKTLRDEIDHLDKELLTNPSFSIEKSEDFSKPSCSINLFEY